MKKFEVLEAHQGDKLYVPGDPETGTRVAELNEVQHLVDLKVLKLIADADPSEAGQNDDARTEAATDAATIADLREQVESLTKERDDARTEAAELSDKLAALAKPADNAAKPADEPAPANSRRARGDK